jgi:hypothetical protein
MANRPAHPEPMMIRSQSNRLKNALCLFRAELIAVSLATQITVHVVEQPSSWSVQLHPAPPLHRERPPSFLQGAPSRRSDRRAKSIPVPKPNPIQYNPFQSNQPESARISRLRDTTYTQTEIANLARLGRSSTQHSTASQPGQAPVYPTPHPILHPSMHPASQPFPAAAPSHTYMCKATQPFQMRQPPADRSAQRALVAADRRRRVLFAQLLYYFL